ncbi:uncharacterized protein LOC115634243 [Scaptodrosophila lebanonensis]|uniref:Uncharacterized protein LOC115634243 n=1 Tax=Drosophila lebanonensis TaxID=7225 RepID=A0A6J2UKE2_DROLE|nr:uncharacterized protein LOC115634243 [Scaptodrosophila lebanonensis]
MLQQRVLQTGGMDAINSALAKQVCTDLMKDNNLTNIKIDYDKDLEAVYLWSQYEDGRLVAFLPTLYSKSIDFTLVNNLQQKLSSSITFLAIVDNTANILYYQISNKLLEKQ